MIVDELEQLKSRGFFWITLSGWAATLGLGVFGIVNGISWFQLFLASAAVNLLPTWCLQQRKTDASAQIAVALMAAAQPAFFVYAMRGGLWQIDMHMYFFVALAMLTVLCEVRPIIVAAALIAVHHLVLAFAAPDWVFSGGGGVARVAIHAFAVVLQASALCFIAKSLAELFEKIANARNRSEQLAAESDLARQDAENALKQVEEERESRLRSERELAERRRLELIGFAEEFEHTVAEVAKTVGDAAQSLDDAASSLDEVANETGVQAMDVAGSAGQASQAAKTVASSVGNLVDSIRKIAETAAQQSELSETAQTRSRSGDGTVSALADRSDSIGISISGIADLAQRTNILALNASIEAVSAGEAGRGFAIVAQEVKSLATQSSQATQEIADLLSGIRDGTREAEDSFAQIAEAIAALAQASLSIQSEVEGQRNSADQIAISSRETAKGFDEISKRIDALAENANRTGRYSTSVRSAASALLEQSRSLESATSQFVKHLRAA